MSVIPSFGDATAAAHRIQAEWQEKREVPDEDALTLAAFVLAGQDTERLRAALADARQLVAQFEYLPYGATVARRVVDGVWVTDDEVAAECNQRDHRCPICTWPQRGHKGPGRYKGNAENTHEEGCSLRAVLDGAPAPRLRRLATRAAAETALSGEAV